MFYSNAYLKGFDLISEVRPALEKLNREIDETIHLGILCESGQYVVYIAKLDSSRVVRMFSRLGQTVPVHCTALGKAILSLLNRDELYEILSDYDFEKFTDHTITTPEAFLKEIDLVKEQGFAIDNMEHEDTIFCIGKPFRDHNNHTAAVSISIPAYRAKTQNIDILDKKLTQTIKVIEAKLFNSVPGSQSLLDSK